MNNQTSNQSIQESYALVNKIGVNVIETMKSGDVVSTDIYEGGSPWYTWLERWSMATEYPIDVIVNNKGYAEEVDVIRHIINNESLLKDIGIKDKDAVFSIGKEDFTISDKTSAYTYKMSDLQKGNVRVLISKTLYSSKDLK